MSEKDEVLNRDHSYVMSNEMMNFRMQYSYRHYVKPIIIKANNMAVRNAAHSLILAIVICVLAVVIWR